MIGQDCRRGMGRQCGFNLRIEILIIDRLARAWHACWAKEGFNLRIEILIIDRLARAWHACWAKEGFNLRIEILIIDRDICTHLVFPLTLCFNLRIEILIIDRQCTVGDVAGGVYVSISELRFLSLIDTIFLFGNGGSASFQSQN